MPVNDYLVPLLTCTLTNAIICLDTILISYCLLNTIIVIIIEFWDYSWSLHWYRYWYWVSVSLEANIIGYWILGAFLGIIVTLVSDNSCIMGFHSQEALSSFHPTNSMTGKHRQTSLNKLPMLFWPLQLEELEYNDCLYLYFLAVTRCYNSEYWSCTSQSLLCRRSSIRSLVRVDRVSGRLCSEFSLSANVCRLVRLPSSAGSETSLLPYRNNSVSFVSCHTQYNVSYQYRVKR